MTPNQPASAARDRAADARVRAAMLATFLVFGGAGFMVATWASRIPQVKDQLGLAPSTLGVVLAALAAGSVTALPLSGPMTSRLGSRRMVALNAGIVGVAMAGVALGMHVGVIAVAAALYVFGFGVAAWDVAMNVQGAFVEQGLGHTIMSRFHAGFSFGTVAGAVAGAAAVATGVSVSVHLAIAAILVPAVVILATRRFLADPSVHGSVAPDAVDGMVAASPEAAPRRGALASWLEPRTLLIGLFVLSFALAEGVGNDWIAVAAIDGHGATQAMGTLALAIFLAAMTTGRWFGPAVLDRYGRVPVVRALALLSIFGTVLYVVAPVLPVAFLGAALWGLGASLGFPVGMSAGADDPARAAGRLSVIASIGYCAFLAGPPLIGFIGDHVGVLDALVAVTVLLAVAAWIAPSVRRPQPTEAGS